MGVAVALSVAVVVYNNVVNRWRPFHGRAYVPVNLVFAGLVALVGSRVFDLSRAELGLKGDLNDLVVPFGLVAVFAAIAFGVAFSRHAHRIADRRVVGMRGSALAFYTLVRIPFGTAVTEEILFRGVLYAVWLEAGAPPLFAALAASVAFGLWHIAPTRIGIRMNDPTASASTLRLAIAGAVVFTTVAGLGLTWLRVETGGLLAPIVLHAGINSVGALAAAIARRRARLI